MCKRDRAPSLGKVGYLAVGGTMLAIAKAVSIHVIAFAAEAPGTTYGEAAGVAVAALAPAAALEAAALWQGFRLARNFLAGPSLDGAVRDQADTLANLMYACFFASALGLLGAGYALDLGMAVAAPVLAPLAPLAIASGVLKLLSASVAKGAAYEEESRNTI